MQIISPKNLKDALIARDKRGYPILAGGTDLVVKWRTDGWFPKGAINIFRLKELAGIRKTAGVIEVGAAATHANICDSAVVKRHLPALVQACLSIGSVQIQNRGTIGGNVMNGSPAGDTLPVLLAYDARVELQSVRGMRLVPFDGFYTGYRKTVVQKDEIVTKFIFPLTPPPVPPREWIFPLPRWNGGRGCRVRGERAVFMKIGTRRAQAISKVCGCFRKTPVAAEFAPPNFGRASSAAAYCYIIAYGSVAPIPIRCKETEEFLAGRKITKDVVESAVRLVQGEVSPIDDIRSSAVYRRHLCGVLLKRFLEGISSSRQAR